MSISFTIQIRLKFGFKLCFQCKCPHRDLAHILITLKNPQMFPALFNNLCEATAVSGIIIPLAYVWRRETPKTLLLISVPWDQALSDMKYATVMSTANPAGQMGHMLG